MSFTDTLAVMLGGALNETLMDQIRLESMEDDFTLSMKDGTMMSMIHLQGALRSPGEEEIESLVENLRIMMSTYFSTPGHAIEVSFMRDAAAAKSHLEKMMARVKKAAATLEMDISDVLEERLRVLSGKMVNEVCLISLYTRPSVLSADEMKNERTDLGKRMSGMPSLQDAQVPGKNYDAVLTRHAAMTESFVSTLNRLGQMARVLTVREALQETRAGLYPDTAANKSEWSPNLPSWSKDDTPDTAPGKSPFTMLPSSPAETGLADFSNLGVPTFDMQLATEDVIIKNTRSIQIGLNDYAAFDMTLAPEVLTDFNDLVSDINAKGSQIPWRATIRMESGGVQATRLKSMYLAIFTWSSPTTNRRIRDAINLNEEIDGGDDTIVKFRMSFATWAPSNQPETLRRNVQSLIGAVKRWGNSGIDGITGDTMATFMSTVPGATMASTAPVAAGPMRDVLGLMPLSRQASPWETGGVMFRTPSGKPWPYEPGSARQTTWVTLVVGTPGSGKSVLMNSVNFASSLSVSTAGGAEPELPLISIIDIGPSSTGLISLVQEALKPEKRHLARYQRLKMDARQAINVFDTQLGMRRPSTLDRQFLSNFISLVCSDGENSPQSAMEGLINAAIDQAYIDKEDGGQPQRYIRHEEPSVDEALDSVGYEPDETSIWWDIVDVMMANGRVLEAELAQRHAVPTISDLVSASQAPSIVSLYGGAIDKETEQTMIESFQRTISEIVRGYPILNGHTQFSIGSARIVSLDLMDVTTAVQTPAARKKTSLMYMLARQVATRDYFLDEKEFHLSVADGILPKVYLKYHVERARKNLQTKKIMCFDEFHRTGSNPAITRQILQDAREGRKFNVDIRILSQFITDFPEDVVEVATGLIVCNTGSEASIDYIDKKFQLSNNDRNVIRHNLRGPGRNGAPVWVMFKMKGEGQVRQELNLTLGPVELWAFSTTADDVALRTRLYEEIGPHRARQVLAARYPGGSAEDDIKMRIQRMEERGDRLDDARRGDVVTDIVTELKIQSYTVNPAA